MQSFQGRIRKVRSTKEQIDTREEKDESKTDRGMLDDDETSSDMLQAVMKLQYKTLLMETSLVR